MKAKKTREFRYRGILDLLIGVKTLLLALIVSLVVLPCGIIYSLAYAVWRGVKLDDWKAPFRFFWSLIDGFLSVIGWLLIQIAVFLDYLWNIFSGEMIEDGVTTREETNFTKPLITVSASCGKERLDGFYIKKRDWFSNLANFTFGQKNHFEGSELSRLAKKNVEEMDYHETI